MRGARRPNRAGRYRRATPDGSRVGCQRGFALLKSPRGAAAIRSSPASGHSMVTGDKTSRVLVCFFFFAARFGAHNINRLGGLDQGTKLLSHRRHILGIGYILEQL